MTRQQIREQTRSARMLDQIPVAEAMHPGVITCPASTPLRDIARMMATHRVHCIIVFGVDEEADTDLLGRLWGVVSDLDLISAAATANAETRTAGATAATAVVLVTPEDTLARAAQLMREHEVTHLVVADRSSVQPVGVLSTLDIARALASE